MAHISVEDYVNSLSDQDLRAQYKKWKGKSVIVVDSTRNIYKKMLIESMTESAEEPQPANQSVDIQDSFNGAALCDDSITAPASISAVGSTPFAKSHTKVQKEQFPTVSNLPSPKHDVVTQPEKAQVKAVPQQKFPQVSNLPEPSMPSASAPITQQPRATTTSTSSAFGQHSGGSLYPSLSSNLPPATFSGRFNTDSTVDDLRRRPVRSSYSPSGNYEATPSRKFPTHFGATAAAVVADEVPKQSYVKRALVIAFRSVVLLALVFILYQLALILQNEGDSILDVPNQAV